MKRFAAIFLFAFLASSARAASETPEVTVVAVGSNTYTITLRTLIRADPQRIWAVLTDYNHHAEILPHLSESRIIGKKAGELIVQQEGQIRVLFWTFRIHVTQLVHHTPPTEMRFHAIAGDFQCLEGVWQVQAEKEGTRLQSEFTLEPKRKVPGWEVRFTAKHYLVNMVQALKMHAEEPRAE